MKIRSKKKMAFLVISVDREGESPTIKFMGIATTFASAYKNAKMFGGISEPNLGYRKAIHQINQEGKTTIAESDKSTKFVVIERVPILVS